MLPWLPSLAMIVADAGYVGYEVTGTILSQRVLSNPHVVPCDFSTRSQLAAQRVLRRDRLLLAETAAEPRKTGDSRSIAADSQPAGKGGRVVVHQRLGSQAPILADRWAFMLSLAMGKRRIFQNLLADVEEGDVDEPDPPAGSP